MTTGGRSVCIACVLLVSIAAPLMVDVRSSDSTSAEPQSIFAVDVPTWFVGDSWTYSTHLHLTMGLNTTDLFGSTTYRVVSLFSVRQNGTLYQAYNVTVNGSFTGSGRGHIDPISFTITIDSAWLEGYQWFDRSDLSLVRDNETISASGSVRILPPPFPSYPLRLKFDSTSNRSPSQEDYDFPILPGDNWTFQGNMRSIGYYFYSVKNLPGGDIVGTIPYDHNTTMDFDARLEEIVDLDVGGSNYHVYHIVQAAPVNSSRAGDAHLWYAPSVKNCVRQYLLATTVDYVVAGFMNLTSYSLTQPPFPLTADLDPQIVNPGGYLNVTGTTNPTATVTLHSPWNESRMTTNADGSGKYAFRVQAPTFDDNTPANADVGSHGVILEASSGIFMSYNASTIVLEVPDLSISQVDIGFSSPPMAGVQTTILATVHTSPGVGVYSPVAVDFIVNGPPLSQGSALFVPAGGQHVFTAPWTPGVGPYVVGVRVDPLDSIAEVNEINNYAEVGGTTELPDLVPWNITVYNGEFVLYDDPARFGYVSQPFNASFGGHVNVTFDVKNLGNVSATGQFRVIVVETLGLRGPPAAPPFLNVILDVSIPPNGSELVSPASWVVPPVAGDYYFNLTVDSENTIVESAEDNNTFFIHVSVGAPDLIVSVTGPEKVPVGGSGMATVVAGNVGNRQSETTGVEVRNATSGMLVGTLPVGPLNPGETASSSFDLSPLASSPGQVCLQFGIDPANLVIELNEANNTYRWCFNVTALPTTSLTIATPFIVIQSVTYVRNSTGLGFLATDHSGTGINRTMYRIDGGAWISYTAGTTFRIDVEGSHTLSFNSTDFVGGAEATNTKSLFVDDIAPVTVGEWNGTAFNFSASDAGCGVADTFYQLDGGAFQRYAKPVNVTTPGDHKVIFYSVDRLGNVEPVHTLPFSIPAPPGGGGVTEVGENLKPYMASAFAILLLLFGLLLWRGGRDRNVLLLSIIFAIIEGATGATSVSVEALALSPAAGKMLSLYVDVAVFILGFALLWLLSRRAAMKAEPEEPRQESPSERKEEATPEEPKETS